MAVARAATTLLMTAMKAYFNAHAVFTTFSIYTAEDLKGTPFPKMPFIAMKISKRTPTQYFTRSIRAADCEVIIGVLDKDTHPTDATLTSESYADWIVETLTNYLNRFGGSAQAQASGIFVLENDVEADSTDEMVNNQLTYMILAVLYMEYETEAL
jgi:hypothetical protein